MTPDERRRFRKLEQDLDKFRRRLQSLAQVARYPIFKGGGGTEIIRFKITEADCAAGTADVTILARPCDISEVSEEGESGPLQVNDPAGCFLDEEDADLVDREGWAAYMKPDGGSECKWMIVSLCGSDECA